MTNHTLTRKLKANYEQCPYCDGDDIDAEPFEQDGHTVTHQVLCSDCGATWLEHFRFSSAMGVNDPE